MAVFNSFCRLLFIALVLSTSWVESANYFDEFRFPDGSVRPQYKAAYKTWSRLTPNKLAKIFEATKRDFSGDNPLGPIPRILTATELAELKLATEQIGATLYALVQDHYSGRKSYEGTVIPKGRIEAMIQRFEETGYAKFITPKYLKQLHFDLGPDFFRDSRGNWRFFEINTQFVGGRGDVKFAPKVFRRRMKDLASEIPSQNDPNEYFQSMVKLFKDSIKQSGPKGKNDGILVYLKVPPYGDVSEKRLEKAFEKEGVVVVGPTSKDKRLIVTKRGVYLEEQKGRKNTRKKVGFVYANGPAEYLEWHHPAVRDHWVLKEAENLVLANEDRSLFSDKIHGKLVDALKPKGQTGKVDMKRVEKWARKANVTWIGEGSVFEDGGNYPGLLEAILDGRVVSNIAPGMEFVDDKELTKYIPALAKHYGIADELVANPVRSRGFTRIKKDGRKILDRSLVREALAYKYRFVIKVANGRGGEGISVGPNVSKKDWKEALSIVRGNPQQFELQDYESPSVLAGSIIDTRTLSIVHPKGVYVSDTPVSRGTPRKGRGKVNISEGGHELVVMVVPDPETKTNCEGLNRVGMATGSRWIGKK